jgi:predicted ABC-type ATPase
MSTLRSLDNATERIAKRDALVPTLKAAPARSFEAENTAFAIADHQGFIDGATGVKPQMATSHSLSDTVAGFMFGGLSGANKSLEIVEKHPGHPDQKVHGGKGGYQATANRREDAMLAGKTRREVPRGADGKVSNPDATGGYKAGIPESIDFGGETLTPEHSLWHHLESDGSGGYRVTEQRAAIHRKVVEEATAGVPKSEDPTFYMLGGGPAAGKSTAVKSGLAGTPDKTKAVQINADDAKSALPEFERMRMSKDDNDFFTAAAFAHEESSYLAKSMQRAAVKNGQDVVLDGTGDSKYSSLSKKVGEAREGGYKVVGIYATVPTNIAVRRANQRSLKESERRFVPEAVVRGTHRDVSRVFPEAVKNGLFDSARLIDTTDTKAVLIGETVNGGWVVQDRSRYNDFVAKGEE